MPVSPAPLVRFRGYDNNNVPLAGGKLFTYAAGTTTKQATYTDSTGNTANTNPIILDSRGEADVWLNPSLSYKLVLSPSTDTDPPTNQFWTRDGLQTAGVSGLLNIDGHRLTWGASPPAWDGVSDYQAYFGQTQPTFLTNGSLGALYGQRLATYTGGATGDATAPVVAAIRGYTQVAASVTYAVEVGYLGIVDNFSWNAQGVGTYGQGNSYHGGRVWGGVHEVHEFQETFTATQGQTVFAVPNGFNAVAAVTKNGTLLTVTSQYTASSPNVTLTSGATAGDIIKVYRGNPQQGMVGTEIDVFAGAGTDTANPNGGNRNGVNIFAYRHDKTINVVSHVGAVINVIADPSDATYLIADRGINFQGQFATGIDFTSSNFTASNWLIKFTAAGAGILPSGIVVRPNFTVATLPAASTALKGAEAFATDLSGASFTYGVAAAGGGSRGGPVFCDGSAWREG